MIRDIFKRQYFGWWLVCSRVASTSVSVEFGKLPYDLVCIQCFGYRFFISQVTILVQCFSVALSDGGFFYIRIIPIGLVNLFASYPFNGVVNLFSKLSTQSLILITPYHNISPTLFCLYSKPNFISCVRSTSLFVGRLLLSVRCVRPFTGYMAYCLSHRPECSSHLLYS
jgi:hypothetical protein